ncbi:MAG: hypothetical protein ACLRSW_17875 [Christensenellaceae bacterium]
MLICPRRWQTRNAHVQRTAAKMCGNAIRCVGKYLYDFRKTVKTQLKIETLNGIKTPWPSRTETTSVVYMGAPSLLRKIFPCWELLFNRGRETGSRAEITCVSMGNPHCVFPTPTHGKSKRQGRCLRTPDFPSGRIRNCQSPRENELKMRAGARQRDMACGTGVRGGGRGGSERLRRAEQIFSSAFAAASSSFAGRRTRYI